MKKNILFLPVLLLLAAGGVFSQTKSFSDAESEMKAFQNPGLFSLVYDETKYATIAELRLDVLEKNDPINKQLKQFEWELTSYFAIKGIDNRPARVVLCINSQSKRWAFQSNNELSLIFDGEDMMLGEPERTTEYRSGKAKERLCWEVDEMITQEFAAAEKIGFQVGQFRGAIGADKRSAFRDYAKLVTVTEKAPDVR